MKDDLVTIQTFNSRMDAEVAKSFLDANGINAVVLADDAAGAWPPYVAGIGVELKVKKSDAQKATELLNRGS